MYSNNFQRNTLVCCTKLQQMSIITKKVSAHKMGGFRMN